MKGEGRGLTDGEDFSTPGGGGAVLPTGRNFGRITQKGFTKRYAAGERLHDLNPISYCRRGGGVKSGQSLRCI